MQQHVNNLIDCDYHHCWLRPDSENVWFSHYLRKVRFPADEHPIKNTLRIELKRYSSSSHETQKNEEATLSFVLDESNSLIYFQNEYLIQNKANAILIISKDWQGLLYAWFHLLRTEGIDTPNIFSKRHKPAFSIRMLNHWDNMDGSIERGYAGKSLFFQDNKIHYDSARLTYYARLLASVGINALTINNVNVHHAETALIDDASLSEVAAIAEIFRQYGIQLYLSVNFAAPVETGDVDSADPLDLRVIAWWQRRAQNIYHHIPDFGGYVVKADSEHRPGPFTYQRTHADGANMLADTLSSYGGKVFWRCFVYNCQQDWHDRATDRAKAAWDHFSPLDGQFHSNVILQIKNGPMDFQTREPTSPLLGAMPLTNKVMELQITQEYTGQQIDLCWLVPQWKSILNFDTTPGDTKGLIRDILAGQSHRQMQCSGITAVVNTGDDAFWTGHPLAQANLYGYGRLLWDPQIDERELAEEWCKLTLSTQPHIVNVISTMLLTSWEVYESYTAPLGVGWMVQPHHHYGPAIDGYEYDRWGTYHYADRYGVGVDRTRETGTGYVQQYHPLNSQMYNDLHSCPQALILFFHHLPYQYVLPGGKTLIQHIYDAHFFGVEQVEEYITDWESLSEDIAADIYAEVHQRLTRQLANARAWRDQINTYFYRKSGIKDFHNRTIYA